MKELPVRPHKEDGDNGKGNIPDPKSEWKVDRRVLDDSKWNDKPPLQDSKNN